MSRNARSSSALRRKDPASLRSAINLRAGDLRLQNNHPCQGRKYTIIYPKCPRRPCSSSFTLIAKHKGHHCNLLSCCPLRGLREFCRPQWYQVHTDILQDCCVHWHGVDVLKSIRPDIPIVSRLKYLKAHFPTSSQILRRIGQRIRY